MKKNYMTLDMHYQEKYEEGLEQAAINSATRMIKTNKLSPEEIALYSGLTLEQVMELKNALKTAQ